VIDLAALTEAIYQRLKSDAAGQGVRDLLPGGSAAIMLAEDLRREGLTVAQLPERPIGALRRGATPQLARVVTAPLYTWYFYDDPSVGYGRLEQLPLAVAEAYESGLTVGTVAVGAVEVAAGPQTRDDTLKLLLHVVTVAIGAV